MSTWWEHALDAFAAGRRASAQRSAEQAERAERAAAHTPKKMAFGAATPAAPKKPAAGCCITNRKLKDGGQ